MLNLETYSQGAFISQHINVLGDRITIDERDIKQIMENQHIRKSKSNIQICKQEIIEFIKLALNDRWQTFNEINGSFGFKC